MKSAIIAILLLASASPAIAADDPLLLAEEAVRANPGIEALRARAQELENLASVAGTWKDPMLSVEYLNAPVDSFRIDQSPMSGIQLQLKQNLPEWGWSRASRELAEFRTSASRHDTAEGEVRLRQNVELLFWQLTLSNMLRIVTQQHVARTQELLGAVRVRYEVGSTGQNALLRLMVLNHRLQDDLGDFERSETVLSAGLQRVLSRPAESRFETPTQADPLQVEGTAAFWITNAKQKRPELARIQEEVKAQTKGAQLARITTRPDVDVWMKYRIRTVDTPLDDGTDFVSLGLSVPIPWGSRKRGLAEEAARLQGERAAKARLAATLDLIESDLVGIEATWKRAYEKASRYQDQLIPDARATLHTTLADFSVGRADFASLYESEVELLMLEKAYLTAAIETYVQRATARATVGTTALGESQ
jgi:cobalt-zinc-cadmium efflux system outer membrane protein